jgi:uncharacterized protein YprB with RNaseH-like and TPR domain
MGLPPDVFKRLSRLNRPVVREQLTTADPVTPRAAPAPAAASAEGEDVTIERLIPGQERPALGGRFYSVRRQAADFLAVPGPADEEAEPPDLVARYRRLFFGAGIAAAPDAQPETIRPLVRTDPSKITYLDIETCGLAGEPVFLIGLMRYDGRTLQIDQFLARDYAEERPLLAGFWEEIRGAACLVTFNGKTFDVPMIESRSMASGIFTFPRVPAHVDLLHEARRRWKRELPNCRLQTLEELVCGHRRTGDIPGSDIPAAYHDFVRARRGDDRIRRARAARTLQAIMHHNALDLVTMAELVTHLLSSRP